MAKNRTLKCDNGRCQGVVAATNLDNVCRNVISHVLVPGAPKKLRDYLKEVKQNLRRLTLNTDTLVWNLERVLNLLRSGKHIGKNSPRGIKQSVWSSLHATAKFSVAHAQSMTSVPPVLLDPCSVVCASYLTCATLKPAKTCQNPYFDKELCGSCEQKVLSFFSLQTDR